MRLFDIARWNRRRHRGRGQSLVEFAIILPIMMVFLAAVLDLGRVFYATISLNNAAREGAFQAAQTPESFDQGQPCNTATNMVTCRVQLESKDTSVQVAATDITMDCSVSGCPAQAGSTVTVGVTGQFELITPLLSIIFGGQTIPMSAEATAQREYLPTPNTATIPPGPVAVIAVTSTNDLTVTFDAGGSSGDPTGWNWDFGDGNFSSGDPTVTHTYAAPGTYEVTLTDRQPRWGRRHDLHDRRRDGNAHADGLGRTDRQRHAVAHTVQLLSAQRDRFQPRHGTGRPDQRRLQRRDLRGPDQRHEEQDPGPEPRSHPVPRGRDRDLHPLPAQLR